MKEYRKSKRAGTIPNNLFKQTTAECIRQLFARGAKGFWIESAVRPLGFIVVERTRLDEPVVHFMWTADSGADIWLFEAAGIDPKQHFFVTHWAKYADGPLFRSARYCPEIARRKDA